MKTTYLILANQCHKLKLDSSKWERQVGDQLDIENRPYRVVAIFETEDDQIAAWNYIMRKRNAVVRRENRLANQAADAAFAKLILQAIKAVDMDDLF